jgi:hypothetical protein
VLRSDEVVLAKTDPRAGLTHALMNYVIIIKIIESILFLYTSTRDLSISSFSINKLTYLLVSYVYIFKYLN